ncbi:MAG: LPS export ABC transporter periplasmic protein LptC [Armatimonadetes bacterium]|nr:LPS export ABC transporter periplasmic protein LptC [Armatimonadota bacterium]
MTLARRRAALVIIGLGAAAVAGVLLWSAAARRSTPGAPAPPAAGASKGASTRPATRAPAPDPGAPYLEIRGTAVTGSDARGRRQWDLRAQSLVVDDAKDVMHMDQVTGTLFRQGAPAITLQAGTGVVRLRTRVVEMGGGVEATSADGRRLRAQQMTWSATEDRLVATGGVTFREGNTTINADRLESDVSLQRTRFSGNVRVRLNG